MVVFMPAFDLVARNLYFQLHAVPEHIARPPVNADRLKTG